MGRATALQWDHRQAISASIALIILLNYKRPEPQLVARIQIHWESSWKGKQNINELRQGVFLSSSEELGIQITADSESAISETLRPLGGGAEPSQTARGASHEGIKFRGNVGSRHIIPNAFVYKHKPRQNFSSAIKCKNKNWFHIFLWN